MHTIVGSKLKAGLPEGQNSLRLLSLVPGNNTLEVSFATSKAQVPVARVEAEGFNSRDVNMDFESFQKWSNPLHCNIHLCCFYLPASL